MATTPTIPDSVDRSAATLRRGSRTFGLASLLLDRRARESAAWLYAWARHCDDVIDGQDLGQANQALTDDIEVARARWSVLRSNTERALAGAEVDDPRFTRFARVVARHSIPTKYPFDLLDGLRQDVDRSTYHTIDDLEDYATLVSGSVAVMMGYVMSATDPAMIGGLNRLGIAIQHVNVARDVVADAHASRVYLPSEWLDQVGVPGDRVEEPRFRSGLARVVRRLLDRATAVREAGLAEIRGMPFRCRFVVNAAVRMYSDIGRIIVRRGERAWDRRAVVGPARKAMLVAQGFAGALRKKGRDSERKVR